MSAEVACLGWRVASSDIILNGDLLRTIPLKFGPIRSNSFREEDFLNIFPIGPMLNVCRLMSAALVSGQGHWTQF